MTRREHRVAVALKCYYLDNMEVPEIRDHLDEKGLGDYTESTIRDYLNEKPKEEVVEQLEQKHANVRLQSAERFEELRQRAREAEKRATRDEAVTATVPKMSVVSAKEAPLRVSRWERVPPGDDRRPGWASERDSVVIFTEGARSLEPGTEYPVGARRGGAPARAGTFPEYRSATVGIERGEPDPKGRAMARKEQARYQEQKADVLGVYETDINMSVDGELETTVELDETAAAAIREATLDDE